MGRPAESKNRPKSDGNGATNGANGVGHNSQLNDDERRALTLHHKADVPAPQPAVDTSEQPFAASDDAA